MGAGVDRVFLHGLCTMALCAQGVVHLVVFAAFVLFALVP